jgi:hypothetical protein
MTVKKPQVKNRLENGEILPPPAVQVPPGGVITVIPQIEPRFIEIEVVGTTPLLVCAWPDKARRMILDKQMKKANKSREAKDPEEDYQNSRYKSTDGWDGVPASGVKGCLVNACRAVDGLPMTLAKRMVFVQSQGVTAKGQELIRIYGEPEMHEGMVRIDMGTADIRFRAMYRKWSLKLGIEFLANVVSAEQVVNLVELAGYIEGLCEHRPGSPKSNTGNFGRFRIRRDG